MYEFIVFENISKRYRDLFALDNVSFNIEEGEIFGYIGPNGAGKTTTIKIIVGLIREFMGKCTIADFSMPESYLDIQKIVGYLPQDVAFQEWRTVEHALDTFGRLSGLKSAELETRITNVLSLFGLTRVRKKKIQKLSGGMVQKVGLAQALLHQPKLLILDEPLSGLDPAGRYTIKQSLKQLSHNGTTIFFSSHILSDVQDVATKIGILHNGRLLKIGSLDELKSEFITEREIEISLSYLADGWEKLRELNEIKKIERKENDRLVVSVEKDIDMDEISDKILKQLIEMNCRIRSFAPLIPNLDDIYLKYINEENKS